MRIKPLYSLAKSYEDASPTNLRSPCEARCKSTFSGKYLYQRTIDPLVGMWIPRFPSLSFPLLSERCLARWERGESGKRTGERQLGLYCNYQSEMFAEGRKKE